MLTPRPRRHSPACHSLSKTAWLKLRWAKARMTARPRRATHAWFESGGARGRSIPGAQRQRNEAVTPAGERQPADPHLRHVPGTHSEVVRMLNLPSERGRGAVMQVATANAHMYGLAAGAPESQILLKGASAGSCGRPAIVSSASMGQYISVRDLTSWKPTAKELTAKLQSGGPESCPTLGALATAVLP